MASSLIVRASACCGLLLAVLALPAPNALIAQGRSPAEGPWSGQAQCVVVAKWADYLDEQTHTWTLTGNAPTPAPRGSAQVYYTWPSTWTVQGSGRKTFPATGRNEQSERWTIASEMQATLRITEIAGPTDRLRIAAEGQRGAPLGSIRVTEVSGRTRDASVQPWQFPTIEDDATRTAISGTSTRTHPEGFGVGWGQPPKVITTATCTWNFTRGGVDQSSANTPTGGRGRAAAARGTFAATGAPVESAASPPPDSPFAGTGGGNGVGLTGQTVSCTTPGPDVEPTVTPTSVRFAWRPVANATSYVVADRNGNPLAPPLSQLTYTYNAPHNHSFSYSYSVTAVLGAGGCAITRLTFTPPRPLTPQVTARVIASTQPGRVTLTWGDQVDLPAYYLVLGPGIPQSGVEVTASRSGQSYEIAQLPVGTHRWTVTPFWRAGGEIVGDSELGARVTATISPASPPIAVGPRTIELTGFSAAGGWTSVAPRSIQLEGFAALGTTVAVGPRTITLDGWTSTGPFPAIQGVVK